MISEKEKKIVAAVNESRGEPRGRIDSFNCIGVSLGFGVYHRAGEIHYIDEDAMTEYWEVICTIEEYNQCIDDMSRADWMYNNSYGTYEQYKQRLDSLGTDTSNKRLLAKHCDYSFYDKPLVYTQDDYDNGKLAPVGAEVLFLNEGDKYYLEYGQDILGETVKVISDRLPASGSVNVQAIECEGSCYCFRSEMLHPIKTPEQIKQDKLDAQANSIFSDLVDDGFVLHPNLISFMQSKGYIVEPK